jgi:hypothetical protein
MVPELVKLVNVPTLVILGCAAVVTVPAVVAVPADVAVEALPVKGPMREVAVTLPDTEIESKNALVINLLLHRHRHRHQCHSQYYRFQSP